MGITYLYSGFDLFRHPTAWYWALPIWVKQLIASLVDINLYLKLQGIAEIILAVLLLSWFLKRVLIKWIALISALELAAILLLAFLPFSQANFLITFRDIGLLGAALSLFVILSKETKPSNGSDIN